MTNTKFSLSVIDSHIKSITRELVEAEKDFGRIAVTADGSNEPKPIKHHRMDPYTLGAVLEKVQEIRREIAGLR
jgi:hypothetical protein